MELFARTEFCNFVGYPFLLLFLFFFNKQEDKYTKLPLTFKLFCEGSCCSAGGLFPGLIAFLELITFMLSHLKKQAECENGTWSV